MKNLHHTNRRSFLLATLAAGTLVKFTAKAAERPSNDLIDVNVNLSRWPLRRVRYDDTAALAGMLKEKKVHQAWAGTFDGLLHKDLGSVNARLTDECRRHGRGILAPFGSINPKLADWEEELRRCAEGHRMIGIRLHPNYHGYKLDHPDFLKLLQLATEKNLIVQLPLLMEDERMMHPSLRVPQVDTTPLADVVKEVTGLKLILLNATGKLNGEALKNLMNKADVSVEIATLEGVGGISNLLTQISADRILFGSYAPLFYFESALLKLKESPLNSETLRLICRGNAHRLAGKTLQVRPP